MYCECCKSSSSPPEIVVMFTPQEIECLGIRPNNKNTYNFIELNELKKKLEPIMAKFRDDSQACWKKSTYSEGLFYYVDVFGLGKNARLQKEYKMHKKLLEKIALAQLILVPNKDMISMLSLVKFIR